MAIEHLAADVERVREHADTSGAVTINTRRVPGTATGRWNTVGVEALGDRDRRGAGRELLEDTPHDGGLRRDDAAFTARSFALIRIPVPG